MTRLLPAASDHSVRMPQKVLSAILATGSLLIVGGFESWTDDAIGQSKDALSTAAFRPALSVGGSNYMFFQLDGCQRSNYVVAAYGSDRQLIDAQLRQIYDSGQRRLRLSIPLVEPKAAPADAAAPFEFYTAQTGAILQTIKKMGFEEVVIVVGDAPSSVFAWTSWNESAYQRRWTAIRGVRNVVAASGLAYRIDLLNEGIPTSTQPILMRYTKRLWGDYTAQFGAADTVGFSVIADPEAARLAQIPEVYGGVLPDVFDFHIYDDAFQSFVLADRELKRLSLGKVSWIIGEAYFDDATEAEQLARAVGQTRRRIQYLLQWPLSRRRLCQDVDVAYPASFDRYQTAGF